MDVIFIMILVPVIVAGFFSLSRKETLVEYGKRLAFTLVFNTFCYLILKAVGVY